MRDEYADKQEALVEWAKTKHVSKDGNYCVKCVVAEGMREVDLPAGLLSVVPKDTGSKKRRSSSPLPLPNSASSESRRVVELQKSHEKKLAAMEEKLTVLRWEASEASKKERARAEELNL